MYVLRVYLRSVLVPLFAAVCSVVLLHRAGGLSWRASFLIPLLGFLAYSYAGNKNRPYRVVYTLNIGNMLIALGLTTEEEWAAYLEIPANPDPSGGDFLARNSLEAVVLSSDNKGGLVYWPQLQKYSHNISYSCNFHSPNGWVRCFIFFGEKGYIFGLSVKDAWWKKNKERVEALGIVKDILPLSYGQQLTLEILPFEVFWQHQFPYTRSFLKLTNRIVPKFGWDYNKYYPEGNYETRFVKVGIYPLPNSGNEA